MGEGRRSEAAQAPGRRVGRRVGERDRHHEGARGRDREGRRAWRASGSPRWSRRRASSIRSSTSSIRDTKRQLLLLTFQAQPSPDDAKQAEELAKTAAEMTSTLRQGRVHATRRLRGARRAARTSSSGRSSSSTSRNPAKLLEDVADLARRRRSRRARSVREVRRARERGRARRSASRTSRELWKSGYDMPADEFEPETDRLWNQVKPLYDAAPLLRAAQAQQDVRRQGRAEDRPDPGAPARQHVGAGVGLPLSRARAVQGRRADRRHAGAREEVRRARRW